MTHSLSSKFHSTVGAISSKRILRWSILGLLFLMGFAIRVYGITNPPLEFHPTRQYRSALIARSYYYETQENIPEWKKEVTRITAQRELLLEPPILEAIAAMAYQIVGGEQLWIPRFISVCFWLIGGVFLYLIALQLTSFEGSVIAVAFYLLLPFGVQASKSFQPEPMMIMLLLAGMYSIIIYSQSQSIKHLIISSLISSIAILVKPNSLFFLYATYVSIFLYKQQDWRVLFRRSSIIFWMISFLPAFLYYVNGIFITGSILGQAQSSFTPDVILQFKFWDGWLKRVRIVMGFTAFLGGFLGIFIFQKSWQKFFVFGLWLSYFVFVFTFTYHAHTHDYYHLPLIVIVALSISAGATLLLQYTYSTSSEWYWQTLLGGTLLAAFILSAGTSIQAQRKVYDFKIDIDTATTIGRLVDHSTENIILDEYYGKSLMYHGEFSGVYWPHTYEIRDTKRWNERELTVTDLFYQFNENSSMHYFVVTDLDEFTKQTDLNSFLRDRFLLVAENESYLIFDLQKRLSSKHSE